MLNHISQKEFIEQQFLREVGYFPNIDNPTTFNEKTQWLKLYYKDPLMTKCTDKYEVRAYIASKIGNKYLIPLVGVYENVNDIDFAHLPKSFILKPNDGSGKSIICEDRSKLNIKETRLKLKEWLNPQSNHYFYSFEWAYKDIKPRIVCESLLDSQDKIKDYKFFCFQGKAKFLHIASERDVKLKIDFYDLNWNRLAVRREYPNSNTEFEKPKNFDKMIEIAETLAEDFPFVRVDLYEVNNKIYFGELTFYSSNGTGPFNPPEWDYTFGAYLDIDQIVTKQVKKYISHKKTRKAKVVIYTAISGDYDRLLNYKYISQDFDYICFTNDKIDNPGIWEIRKLEYEKSDQIRNARYCKLFPNLLLPKYEHSIWIDANIDILDDVLEKTIYKLILQDNLIAMNVHYNRNCIYQEAEECIRVKKDTSETISKQVSFLRKENYPENHGLFETNIIFRKHKDTKIIKLMEHWWHMICTFSYRDQLSFNYVLWKNGQTCLRLFPSNARLMDDFGFKHHNPQTTSTLYVNFGSGFNNTDCIRKKILVLQNKFDVSFELDKFKDAKECKFNISKNQYCFLKIDAITLHTAFQSYLIKQSEIIINNEATLLVNGFIDFSTSNPEITFPGKENITSIEIKGEVRFYDIENRFFYLEQALKKIKSSKAYRIWHIYRNIRLFLLKKEGEPKIKPQYHFAYIKEYKSQLQHELDFIQNSLFYRVWQRFNEIKKLYLN